MSYKPQGAIIITADGQGQGRLDVINITAAQGLEMLTSALSQLQQRAITEAVAAEVAKRAAEAEEAQAEAEKA